METKNCPFCGEKIKIEAIKCKHCGEFLNKSDEKQENYSQEKLFDIPAGWVRLKKIKWLGWIGLVILFLIIMILSITQFEKASISDFITILSTVIDFIALYFIYQLMQYMKNYKKELTVFKIYIWLYGIMNISVLLIFFAYISNNNFIIGLFNINFVIGLVSIYLLLIVATYVCQFMVASSLMRIKNDIVGGLKMIGTTLFIFTFIAISFAIISFIITYIIDSSNPSLEILSSLISIVLNFIIIYLISETLMKAVNYNNHLTTSQIQ